ncbi:MAG: hypothetical protein WB764_30065, partial [Xanthobacteraceae bacterium]
MAGHPSCRLISIRRFNRGSASACRSDLACRYYRSARTKGGGLAKRVCCRSPVGEGKRRFRRRVGYLPRRWPFVSMYSSCLSLIALGVATRQVLIIDVPYASKWGMAELFHNWLSKRRKHAIENYVPPDVLSLKTEANLLVVNPWFEKSLCVAGDVAEFGCFRGTMSIKYAHWIKGMRQPKRVFAFDTFDGFHINDPAGGPMGVGSYADNDNAFDKLMSWSRVVPVVPVKGDATETYKILAALTDGPLSFVWLDLDMDVFMEPVRQGIFPLLTKETIIGIDDYGRPECPAIKP